MEYTHERQSLNVLKQRITEQYGNEEAKDEARLMRFLIARDFDVNNATTMLSNHIKWRRKQGIDDILHSYKPLEVLQKYYPITELGFSKNGEVVSFLDFGGFDMIGAAKSASKMEFALFITSILEGYAKELSDKSEREGKLYEKWILIFDFEKVSLSQVTNKDGMELFLSLFPIYEANYPERLKNAIVINASLAFTVCYAFLKPILEEKTRNKVKVFGKSGWKEELTNIIDYEILPAFLGGSRTDPNGDPMCPSLVNRGGTISQKYYITSKSEKNLSSKPGVRKYVVGRLSRISVRVDVVELGSKIEWEFQTENYEIGFGIRYFHTSFDGSRKTEDILPVQKVDTRVFCETGTYFCEKTGTYMLLFDNSFSWFRSKELYVKANVVAPDGRKSCFTS